MKKALLVSSFICALSGFAQAADVIEPMPEALDWSGFYIGAQIGYGWGDFGVEIIDSEDGWDGDIDGILGGVHAGYNVQIDQFVLGLEADIEASDMDGSDKLEPFEQDEETVEINFLGSIRARAGLAFDNVLVYATGGLAGADATFTSDILLGGTSDNDVTFWGYTVGGGLEVALSKSLSARVEYRYTDFGKEDFNPASISCLPVDCELDGDVDFHALRAGISWHFGAM